VGGEVLRTERGSGVRKSHRLLLHSTFGCTQNLAPHLCRDRERRSRRLRPSPGNRPLAINAERDQSEKKGRAGRYSTQGRYDNWCWLRWSSSKSLGKDEARQRRFTQCSNTVYKMAAAANRAGSVPISVSKSGRDPTGSQEFASTTLQVHAKVMVVGRPTTFTWFTGGLSSKFSARPRRAENAGEKRLQCVYPDATDRS